MYHHGQEALYCASFKLTFPSLFKNIYKTKCVVSNENIIQIETILKKLFKIEHRFYLKHAGPKCFPK